MNKHSFFCEGAFLFFSKDKIGRVYLNDISPPHWGMGPTPYEVETPFSSRMCSAL